MSTKKKVLMFGWEFPPLMAGGLGVACLEMVKALVSEKTNLQLVLPQTTGQEHSEGFDIYDASTWQESINNEYNKTKIVSKPFVSPYDSAKSPVAVTSLSTKAIKSIIHQAKQKYNQKNIKSLYDNNLMDRVYQYGQTAKSIAQHLDFDIIHCHDWMTVQAGLLAKHVSGKPLVLHVHCTEYDRCPHSGNEDIHRLEKQGCEIADKVIAVSNWTKQVLINKYHINPDKIEVVHNGVNQGMTYPKPRPFTTKNPKILFLGRVTYQKGPNYFLEGAYKALKQRNDIEFVIAGTGDMLDYLKGRVFELGIQKNVTFLGGIKPEKVKDIYQSADGFILSSVSEPFGLTVLEALSYRIPVILCNQSGASEVLRHVLTYDFWDTDKLAEYILSIVNYENLAQSLKEKSIDDLKNIKWSHACHKLHHIYNQY